MPDGSSVVRRVAWRELCPWLIIFRTFRLSISPPVLFLATVGALLTPLGWVISSALLCAFFSPQSRVGILPAGKQSCTRAPREQSLIRTLREILFSGRRDSCPTLGERKTIHTPALNAPKGLRLTAQGWASPRGQPWVYP